MTWSTAGGWERGAGRAILDFGALPSNDASVVVTGQERLPRRPAALHAWVVPEATADHNPNQHRHADLRIFAGAVVAGSGFTIWGVAPGAGLTGQWTVAWWWQV